MRQVHYLKVLPQYFEPVDLGLKPFEIRFNDRDYQLDDILYLQEWDYKTERYTGHRCSKRITYILKDTDFLGLANGYCAMGLGDSR